VALAGMLAYASATSAGAGAGASAAGTGRVRAAARGAGQAWPSRYEGALLFFAGAALATLPALPTAPVTLAELRPAWL
jgi:hypothetical protein